MEPSYWHHVWEQRDIGFDQAEPNPLLKRFISHLLVEKNSRIFLPLCGKSIDAMWLHSQGYHVVGCELSAIAVNELFEALQITPTLDVMEHTTRYYAKNIEIFCGDLFALDASTLGKIDAIYDRAAIVAMPEHMRRDYAMQLHTITQNAPQLVICYEFSDSDIQGPPFHVSQQHLQAAYLPYYSFQLIEKNAIVSQKGNHFHECIWYLT